MTRIRARTPDDFDFKQQDTVPTRVQKLNLLKNWVIEQITNIINIINNLGDGGEDGGDGGDGTDGAGSLAEKVRTWWNPAPTAKQTLLIWPFADKVTFRSDFAGAVGYFGGILTTDAIIEIYRAPEFVGGLILTAGELIGTVTIDHTDNSFSFETTGHAPYIFNVNDTLAAKWPDIAEVDAHSGAFVLQAFFGNIISFHLLLAGDQQSGDDILLLSGDQSSSADDALLVHGG